MVSWRIERVPVNSGQSYDIKRYALIPQQTEPAAYI
jgi:hypothetical protein